jgi:hypothetical protein
MELKNFFTIFFLFGLTNSLNADVIKPNENMTAYDVVKIQLIALKNNNVPEEDSGIKQTWIFAHPENKKITGPFERFRVMLYGAQYNILLNHDSHKIKLIMNTNKKYIYGVELLSKDKKLYFYEWHLERSSVEGCNNCWFTTAVSSPTDQGNTI